MTDPKELQLTDADRANLDQAYEAVDQLVDVLTKDTAQPFFDLIFVFSNAENGSTMELFMDENVQLTIAGLLKEHKFVALKTNWFAKGLTVHGFDQMSEVDTKQETLPDASVRPQELRTGTKQSNAYKRTNGRKTKA
jgi:hypothetical protein